MILIKRLERRNENISDLTFRCTGFRDVSWGKEDESCSRDTVFILLHHEAHCQTRVQMQEEIVQVQP